MDQTRFSTNNFTNYRKLISLADLDWETAQTGKIAGLNVEIENTNHMVDQYGRTFITSAPPLTWGWIIIQPCLKGP